MTKKDYIIISNAVYEVLEHNRDCGEAVNLTRNILHKIADAMTKDNPRFDRQRFLKACGLIT